jgi:hypothetical protein
VIAVRPRVVARPWDPEVTLRASRPTAVHREAHVEPEPGPLAEYLRVFPGRYVLWNVRRQLFEVRETDPDTGKDVRVALVCHRETDPTTGHEAQLFRPFDWQYVEERKAEWYLLRHEGADALHRKVEAQNARAWRTKRRDAAREMAAGLNDIKGWLPVLQALNDGARPDVALLEKPVVVSPGVTLTRG